MSDDLTPHQQEAQLADDYLKIAALGREVAGYALDQALEEAKNKTLRDPAKTATSAITASAIALDKRLLLQERPTQIVAIDPSQALNALARRVGVKYDADTTGVEIPATTGFPQSYGKPPATPPHPELPADIDSEPESSSASPLREPEPKRAQPSN